MLRRSKTPHASKKLKTKLRNVCPFTLWTPDRSSCHNLKKLVLTVARQGHDENVMIKIHSASSFYYYI